MILWYANDLNITAARIMHSEWRLLFSWGVCESARSLASRMNMQMMHQPVGAGGIISARADTQSAAPADKAASRIRLCRLSTC